MPYRNKAQTGWWLSEGHANASAALFFQLDLYSARLLLAKGLRRVLADNARRVTRAPSGQCTTCVLIAPPAYAIHHTES